VIPPKANAEFVSHMEDVLEVYARPHDPNVPLVWLDETSKQLVREVRAPQSATPGRPACEDYEYERNGVAALFMLVAPLEGWRHVTPRAQRTRLDYAHCLRELAEVHFPHARCIVLVQDNLNTHSPASLYEAFPPAQARALTERFEWHFTPKHGSWLNVAEIELQVLARQCLDRRLPELEVLQREVAAWSAARNRTGADIHWRFTNADARIKLRKLYPTIDD
jgi:hypothetical protein